MGHRMTLHEIRPGLRVINRSNAVAKVTVHVAAGDELEVSAEVAAQLGPEFVAADPDVYKRAVPYPPVVDAPAAAEPVEHVAASKPRRSRRS